MFTGRDFFDCCPATTGDRERVFQLNGEYQKLIFRPKAAAVLLSTAANFNSPTTLIAN